MIIIIIIIIILLYNKIFYLLLLFIIFFLLYIFIDDIYWFGVASCRYIPHAFWNYKECIYMYIICKHLFFIYENIDEENCFFQGFRRKIQS